MELEFGGPLFIRNTRKTELTERGRLLLSPVRRVVEALEDALDTSETLTSGEAGSLTIGFPSGAAHHLLPRILPLFAQRYPRVNLQLQEATSSEAVDLLDAESIDVGIIHYPIASNCPYFPIPGEEDELVAVFPKDYPLAAKGKIKLADLAGHPFIAFEKSRASSLEAVISMACQRAGFTPCVVQHARRVDTVISLVRSGVGIALVPKVCAATYEHVIDVRSLAEQSDALKIGLAVIFGKNNKKPCVDNFLEIIGVKEA
ncbi:LysR family transcriptional regulator [Comamonas humi]